MNDPEKGGYHCYWEGGVPRAWYWSDHEGCQVAVTRDTPELWFDMLSSVGEPAAVEIYTHLFGATIGETLRILAAERALRPD
jgi:hypothetical protein